MARKDDTNTATVEATSTEVTAYGFAKVVNTRLEELGIKQLPAQMFYTYKSKGLIGTEEKPLTSEYAAEWVEAYAERKATKEAQKQAKLEAELKGESTTDTTSEETEATESE